MWRRASSQLQTLAAPWRRSTPHFLHRSAQNTLQSRAFASASITSSPFRKTSSLLSSESDNVPTKKRVEDVMPIATGNEREELEAELEGRKRFTDMDAPVGPFGTKPRDDIREQHVQAGSLNSAVGLGKESHRLGVTRKNWAIGDPTEAPAVIKSYYNKRIVGCPGGEGEDEHDVVWFWLEKDKPHECPVCSQYFVLEVIGEGEDPEPHSDDEHH